MNYYPFDSRNSLYKSHIGAVAAGDSLRLRLLVHKDAHCHSAFLIIRNDSSSENQYIEMVSDGTLEDYIFYSCEISRDAGLYWYAFKYTSDYGDFFVTKHGESLGVVSADQCNMWQLTVYESDFKTPEWLKGGIIYQIFPDRFAPSGTKKDGVPQDRFLCSDWRKQPEYRQNGEKCSLGNDYYGGDLAGITQKLPYLKSLGVSCIYLNPIFEAHSNHRYNTADYLKIDHLLGNEKDLRTLCEESEKQGISVILDGVFSHTGDDSIYFNRQGRYNTLGAFNDENSEYYNWYKFLHFPDDYAAWWGVPSLPETDEENSSFREFITGKDGVLRHWLRCGVRGWRLDVADELPDSFLDSIRTAIKQEKPDAYLLGEVWEDASNKISYGERRRFLRGSQLDSVMNYPFADGIIDYIKSGDALPLCNTVLSILENYPMCCVNLLMNHIGTHDTARILTRLSDSFDTQIDSREWQSRQVLSSDEYTEAKKRLFLAVVLQFTLPGVPSVFYGDESGLQGYGDPFCRATYPWGNEDTEILEFYQKIGTLRRGCEAFKSGEYKQITAENGVFCFERASQTSAALIAVNRSRDTIYLPIPTVYNKKSVIFGSSPKDGFVALEPSSFTVILADLT